MRTTQCSDYVLFDLETTGLSTESDCIVEISALKVIGNKIVDEYSTLVNPGIHIPYYASSVNGITDDMVEDAPHIIHALKDFIDFAGSFILMGHNIRNFDMRFIRRDSKKFFGRTLDNDCVDTLILARRYLPDIPSHSLESLARHYGISYAGAHRALADCHINKQVYDRLLEDMKHPSEAARQVQVCPKCGNLLKRRSGIYGDFLGCSSYPDCKYTRKC